MMKSGMGTFTVAFGAIVVVDSVVIIDVVVVVVVDVVVESADHDEKAGYS